MNNLYLIPANSNSGKLIFNLFTKFDLILASSGAALSGRPPDAGERGL